MNETPWNRLSSNREFRSRGSDGSDQGVTERRGGSRGWEIPVALEAGWPDDGAVLRGGLALRCPTMLPTTAEMPGISDSEPGLERIEPERTFCAS